MSKRPNEDNLIAQGHYLGTPARYGGIAMTDGLDRRDFFISFNQADEAYAKAIDAALRMDGFTTFYHPRDLKPGGNIPVWMDDALINSTQTLALYSPDYTKDTAVFSKAERYATWFQDPLNDKRKLIPVLLRETAFTPLMDMISRIEVVGTTPQEAAATVVARLHDPDETKQRDHWRSRQPLPKIFAAAYGTNPNFTGRFEALESLAISLRQQTNAAVTAVAGMGGVGKTTLAAEYCHRFGGQYSGVWWIRAEQESVVLSDLKDLGRKLGLPEKQNVEEAAKDCLDDLANKTHPFLLVYDNAPNPDSVRKHLPHGATRCIITSRFTEFSDIAQVIRLDKWPDEITRDYLLSRTGRNDAAGALRLAKTLDGLPLAAEQAAAFLKTRPGISFGDYIGEIGRLIKEPRPAGAKGEYPETVYAAFVKSLDALQITKEGETALDILRLCAFLSPDGVDLPLLTGPWGRNVLPNGFTDAMGDKFKREGSLAALISHSLVRREDGPAGHMLIFHRLLLAVVRDWMGKDARALWSSASMELVVEAFPRDPGDNTSVWPLCERLIAHIVFFKDQIPYENTPTWLPYLLIKGRVYLVAVGDFAGALSLAEPYVELSREKDDLPGLAAGLKHLADLFFDLGHLKEAEDKIREALKLRDLINSPPHDANRMRTLLTLAEILTQKGEFVEAEKYFVETENFTKTVFGDHSAEYGTTLNNFGEHYAVRWRKTGNKKHLRKAMAQAEKALAIAREVCGERHPITANRLSFYSMIKPKKASNWRGAVAELEESVAIMLSLGLPEHPYAIGARDALIPVLRASGQSSKADRIARGDYSDLLPVIHQIEDKHRTWVAQDPANREFGPTSPYTGPTLGS